MGASGFLGTAVIRRLNGQGYRVGALARKDYEQKDLQAQGLEAFLGDINDDIALAQAFEAFRPDVVIHLVGIVKEPSREVTFEKIHIDGTRNVVVAAKATRVKKLVYVSALGADSEGETAYYRSKSAAEKLIKNSGLNYTILRPSLMFGRGAGFTNQLMDQMRHPPFIPVVGKGDSRFQIVSVDAVADCIVKSIDLPNTDHRIYDIVGPEALSLEAITQRLAQRKNFTKPVVHLPRAFMLALAWMCELGLPAPITRDQVLMLLSGSVGDDRDMLATFNPPIIRFDPDGDYPLY